MNLDATHEVVTLHVLPPLPYAESALDPVISANTIGFHYEPAPKAPPNAGFGCCLHDRRARRSAPSAL